MVIQVLHGLLVVSIAGNGLLAGLFLSFTCAITPALRRVDDRSYVRVFRVINAAIVSRAFLLVFFAAPVSAAAGVVLGPGHLPSYPWLVVGALCSALTFAITVVANVPLNRGLGRAVTVTDAQYREARGRFEARWNRWNVVRTLTAGGALVLLAMAGIV